MSLQMTRPTKHPETGTYRVRLAIPKPLGDTAKRLYGRRAELIENLHTKDPKEARRLSPAALARLQQMLSDIQRAAKVESTPPSERDIQGLAGDHYRTVLEAYGDNPGEPGMLDDALDALESQIEQVDENPEVDRVLHLSRYDLSNAREALAAAGLALDPASVRRAAEARFKATVAVVVELGRRAGGDWRDRPDTFPKQAPARQQQANACTFDTLLAGLAGDRGWSLTAKPQDPNVYGRMRTVERFAAFFGFRDATRLVKSDVARWKANAQARGLKASTIRNDLSEMSRLYLWGLANGAPLPHGNPFDGLLPPKPTKRPNRRPFTDAEACTVLAAARGQSGLLRWLPWLCCLTGARLTEAVQSVKEDVCKVDGVLVLRVHDEGDDPQRSVKNADSRRMIPLHPALIAEGFLAYVAALPKGSPLFPDVAPDAMFGRRAAAAGKRVGEWMRTTLQLSDPGLAPNHSWRHWFIDACRAAEISPEIRSALTGHAARIDESSNYGRGTGTLLVLLARSIAKVKLPKGLDRLTGTI